MAEQNQFLLLADDLIKKAGFNNLPPDYRADYRQKLVEQMGKRLSAMALKELTPELLAEFTELDLDINQPDPQKTFKFFEEHITDFDRKVKAALAQFAAEFVARAKRVNKTLSK